MAASPATPAAPAGWLEYLRESGDWAALVVESRRRLFDDPGDTTARLLLAAAYDRTGRGEQADRILEDLSDGPLRHWVLLERADEAREDDPWLAIAWLQRDEVEFPDSRDGPWRRGALARVRLEVGDLDGARAALAPDDRDLLPASIRHRAPAATGLASAVVPGLGQLASGQPVEAASAFLVVGGLAGATAWAGATDHVGTAAVVGSVAFLFWAGNVYGGADAALRFDRARLREARSALDAAGIPGGPPAPVPAPQEPGSPAGP